GADDALKTPYALEEVSPDERARIERLARESVKEGAVPGFAERMETMLPDGSVSSAAGAHQACNPEDWLDRVVPSSAVLHGAALERYRNRCAITGLPLGMPGGLREGFVVPLHFSGVAPRAICDVIPVTGTLAFCYAHRLVAATDGLALWLHPLLPWEIAALLRELNPAQRLNVPEAPADW